mmetsp:Transcript_30341/g.54959  ORF Transcript_30341/g.54959 Transcript_30341/m.54959 type:complete len:368 (-) Transcript_30341:29-1132(-)
MSSVQTTTKKSTLLPSSSPTTGSPSKSPSIKPTSNSPSSSPLKSPIKSPSLSPNVPTQNPLPAITLSNSPSMKSSNMLTSEPTSASAFPSHLPTSPPLMNPTTIPSLKTSTVGMLYCILVMTGSNEGNGGLVNILVDSGDGYVPASTSGKYYTQSEVVVDQCFADMLVGVKVTNPTTNDWVGSILFSTDEKATYAPFLCDDCTGSMKTADPITVNGDAVGRNDSTAQCLNGASCSLLAKEIPDTTTTESTAVLSTATNFAEVTMPNTMVSSTSAATTSEIVNEDSTTTTAAPHSDVAVVSTTNPGTSTPNPSTLNQLIANAPTGAETKEPIMRPFSNINQASASSLRSLSVFSSRCVFIMVYHLYFV